MKRTSTFVMSALAVLFVATPAHAFFDLDSHPTDYTAYTLRAREVRLGLFEWDFGLFRPLTIGTDTAPWVAGIIFRSVAENLHAKLMFVHTAPISIALGGAVYHATADVTDAGRGSVFILPVSFFASSEITRALSLHFETTYAHVAIDGNANLSQITASGEAVTRTLQLGLLEELRVSRVFAFQLRQRLEPSIAPAILHSEGTTAPGTTLTVDASIYDHTVRYAFVGGIAISGKNFDLDLGAGYGSYFIPSIGIALSGKSFIPSGDIDVRF
jgi:hypothetical protein